MKFSIREWTDQGTIDSPYRPKIDGPYDSIDMRPDPTSSDGVAFVAAEDGDFDSLDESLPAATVGRLGRLFGVDLVASDLRGIVTELLLVHGDATPFGSRWRKPQAGSDGWHRILLGETVYAAPAMRAATIGDTFVESSDTVLTSHTATGPNGGFSWTVTGGSSPTVIAATDDLDGAGSGTNHRVRAESDLSSADHYAQFKVVAWESSTISSLGPCVRYASAADTLYTCLLRDRADDQYRLFKLVASSFTQIGSSVSEALPAEPVTAKLEIDGSTLTLYIDDVSKISETDSSITGNTRTGLLIGTDATLDDFEAADLAAGDGGGNLLLLGVG